jgi:hypothetical protein
MSISDWLLAGQTRNSPRTNLISYIFFSGPKELIANAHQPVVMNFTVRLLFPPRKLDLHCIDKDLARDDLPPPFSYTSNKRNQDQLKLADFLS